MLLIIDGFLIKRQLCVVYCLRQIVQIQVLILTCRVISFPNTKYMLSLALPENS